MTKKQLATTAEQLPAYLAQGQGARGSEQVESDDMQLPRIKILQALSPEISKADRKIPGAEIGMFVNTLTGEMFESATIVPVYFVKKWMTWPDRDKRPTEQLRGVFDDEVEATRAKLYDDDLVQYTPTHIVLIVSEAGGIEEASIPCPSTKIKVSKQLNSLIRMGKVDSFAQSFTMTSVNETNAKGDFANFRFTPAGFVSEEVYRYGESLYEALHSGSVNISDDSLVDTGDDDGEGPPAGF
tara:strand:+ start:3520 stop:4242 length:723 start_codon:yes stop_codon:yes gene_type:complete